MIEDLKRYAHYYRVGALTKEEYCYQCLDAMYGSDFPEYMWHDVADSAIAAFNHGDISTQELCDISIQILTWNFHVPIRVCYADGRIANDTANDYHAALDLMDKYLRTGRSHGVYKAEITPCVSKENDKLVLLACA